MAIPVDAVYYEKWRTLCVYIFRRKSMAEIY